MTEEEKINALVAKRTSEAKERLLEQNQKWKRRLIEIVRKKFKTTFIGAISAFEENFGDYWGHNVPDEDKDDEQVENQRYWHACRSKILDNGNAQLRAVEKELDLHDVSWHRHHRILPVVNNTHTNHTSREEEEKE